ncbi:hypothetical protein CI102_3756 [Trichoderma harzianum]|nr:hypothetical protein CI102_3756 [Trichoderma harzianum]
MITGINMIWMLWLKFCSCSVMGCAIATTSSSVEVSVFCCSTAVSALSERRDEKKFDKIMWRLPAAGDLPEPSSGRY